MNGSMAMPGMKMGGGSGGTGVHHASSSAMTGMAMGQAGHRVVNLLPEWLGILGTVIFIAIALSHLRHMRMSRGERTLWHSCHVLMAVGMAFMYAPAAIHPPHVATMFWQVVFAVAAVLAALWAFGGGRRAPNVIWLLTAVDLGVMAYMWSSGSFVAPLSWVLVAYLVCEAGLWVTDAYHRLDGGAPVTGWTVSGAGGEGGAIALRATAPAVLLGDLNLSVSMVAMTIGMAYMLAAMQVMIG